MSSREAALTDALRRTHASLNDLLGFVDATTVGGSMLESIRGFNIFYEALDVLVANRHGRLIPSEHLPLSGNLVDAAAARGECVS
jgi:hypothetical protein